MSRKPITPATMHNVYRIGGGSSTSVGKVARHSRAAADHCAEGLARAGDMRRVGIWHVRDHSAVIAALCSPSGRVG
ncbi:hypothetical protein ACH37Y_06275 [Sphingomonas paucimobilis]|uniref:hypothetical protein n=1 Tax=Sphingomonas paucimobilis TaxID=13689 RepID=UPI00064C0C28|nr:hypothetical protein [Sphingomonas paucimobilis]